MSERHDRLKRIRRERRRERRKQRSFKRTVKVIAGWIATVVVAAILGYGFVAFGFQKVYMAGPSMSDTLINGEEYTANQLVYILGTPKRYDVVAYKSIDNQDAYYSIKRIVGLPGETVLIQNGQVYINGNPLVDSPISDYINTPGLAETSLTLGDDEYFVLGDNVNNSVDSRFTSVGNVQKNEIMGRIKTER
jgi:signal peptidase I